MLKRELQEYIDRRLMAPMSDYNEASVLNNVAGGLRTSRFAAESRMENQINRAGTNSRQPLFSYSSRMSGIRQRWYYAQIKTIGGL